MQPYEKFKKFGAKSLTDEELLAIFIRTGTKEKNSVEIARQILELFPERGLLGLFHIHQSSLMEIPGIGEVKAVKLLCLAELAQRISRIKAEKNLQFEKPATVAEYYMESLRHEEKEQVILVLLDKRLRLLKDVLLSVGTISESVISPREIFVEAFKENAAQFMLLHNHPSGDPEPSASDLKMTERVKMLSQFMGIPLIDHIIIGDNCYVSLREKGCL